MISFASLIISILAIILSLSKIQVSMFEKRYSIYSAAKKQFLKFLSAGHASDLLHSIRESDILEINEMIDKAYFLFGNDKNIQTELEFLKTELVFYFQHQDNEDNPNRQQMWMEAHHHFNEIGSTLRDKNNNRNLEKSFEHYLKISYFPSGIISFLWKFLKDKISKLLALILVFIPNALY